LDIAICWIPLYTSIDAHEVSKKIFKGAIIIKKIIFILVFLITTCMVVHADDIQSQDLKFQPQGGGKFIYCNNSEAIYRTDLSDTSNQDPMYLMNNDHLTAGKYSFFASHINHTELKDKKDKITEMGFDIELDVQFKANVDSQIVINAIGFDVQKSILRKDINGNETNGQSSWDFVDAWSNYKQVPIYTLDTNEKSYPKKFSPIVITMKAGEEKWLSEYIDNYAAVPCLKVVQILSDFTISSGDIDVNVAALKHDGILKDRSHHDDNAKSGIYARDKQYKGIADTLPSVNSSLTYTIDNRTKNGTLLPVKVYNQYQPNGKKITKWFTNINPQADIWSRNNAAESDMLSLKYQDPDKLKYYSSDISQDQRDDTWVFDVFHSDTKESSTGIPNYKLSTDTDNRDNACNLGNYGVSTNYTVTIDNQDQKRRYLNYKLNTKSTNIVTVKDKNGKQIMDYAVRKRPTDEKEEDVMASIELPANEVSTFTIEVILPANYPGGMENSFEISNSKSEYTFDNGGSETPVCHNFTGKEYYKWYDKNLCLSDDGITYTKKPISEEAAQIFDGNWNNFELQHFGDLYVARLNTYDSTPYFYNQLGDSCNKVYYFDDNFNVLAVHNFSAYPEKVYEENGEIITLSDGINFSTTLPNLEKMMTVRVNNQYVKFDVNPIIESGRTLVPLRAIFEALSAKVDWDELSKTAKVFDQNTALEFSIDNDIATVNGEKIKMDVPARQYGFRTLIPLRFISETLGYSVTWNDSTKTIDISAK